MLSASHYKFIYFKALLIYPGVRPTRNSSAELGKLIRYLKCKIGKIGKFLPQCKNMSNNLK